MRTKLCGWVVLLYARCASDTSLDCSPYSIMLYWLWGKTPDGLKEKAKVSRMKIFIKLKYNYRQFYSFNIFF